MKTSLEVGYVRELFKGTFKSGLSIGRLKLIKRIKKNRMAYWLCLCKCGTRKYVNEGGIRLGTSSCGCLASELLSKRNLKHGRARSPEWIAWVSMKTRCYNKNYKGYANYGGRGIKVCARWMESFQAFFDDVGKRPSENHSIDRLDSNKGYLPGNVRWSTYLEQNRNRKYARTLTVHGQTKPLIEWARSSGLEYPTLKARVDSGMSPEGAISKPLARRRKQSK